MDHFQAVVKLKSVISLYVLVLCFVQCTNAWNTVYTHDGDSPNEVYWRDIHTIDRHRRDAPLNATESSTTSAASATSATTTVASPTSPTTTPAPVTDVNKTTNTTDRVTPAQAVVTQTPLLGVNGSGILHVDLNTTSANDTKVSEPLFPDENITEVFKGSPEERIQSEKNLTHLTIDNHNFYNSTFIGNETYFNEYWANITREAPQVHPVLSNSHRRATTIQLKFNFSFYGHNLHNITVATGGFIYTGDHVHNWLAATQYIAPLMANFDTSTTNESYVKLYDDGHRFTAFWENVSLQEDPNKKFTFAVTLYENGDIIFAYKDVPLDVQAINDSDHPVKVGISDAYLSDKIVWQVRRKTIYEYHRVTFKSYMITSNTILKLIALPTCVQYQNCADCLNHDTGFNCSWCPTLNKCSSGTDRYKQDWTLRQCEQSALRSVAACTEAGEPRAAGNETVYTTDTQSSHGIISAPETLPDVKSKMVSEPVRGEKQQEARSPIGGAVVAFLAITLVCSLGAWVLYAFKNPHTRSGQLLIKYRPSQWNWRRGEARYTAATIHM